MIEEKETEKIDQEIKPIISIPLRAIDGSKEAIKVVKLIQDLNRCKIPVGLEDELQR